MAKTGLKKSEQCFWRKTCLAKTKVTVRAINRLAEHYRQNSGKVQEKSGKIKFFGTDFLKARLWVYSFTDFLEATH